MTYKFKTGDKGKTRGGYDYEVLRNYLHVTRERCIAVLITFNNGDQEVISIAENGISGGSGEYDLIPPTRKVYVNFYRDDRAYWHETSSVAVGMATPLSPNCIAVAVEVEIPCE